MNTSVAPCSKLVECMYVCMCIHIYIAALAWIEGKRLL